MTRAEIASTIENIIRTNMPGYEDVAFAEDTRINNEAGFDSMTFVYLMCKIEAAFDVKIPKRRWEKMMSFGDVVDAVEKALASK